MADRHSQHGSGKYFYSVGTVSVILICPANFLSSPFPRIKKLTGRTKTDIDNRTLEPTERPLAFTFVIIGLYISGQMVALSPDLEAIFGQIIRSLIAFTIFWAIFRILDPLSILLDRTITLFGNISMHETIKGFFVKVAKFEVVCLGVAAVFQEWGFNVAAVFGSAPFLLDQELTDSLSLAKQKHTAKVSESLFLGGKRRILPPQGSLTYFNNSASIGTDTKGIRLVHEGILDIPEIRADENWLFNAFYNLVNNALAKVPSGG